MPPPAKASDLLRFRLSPAEFEAYVAQSRKPRLGYCEQSGTDIDPSKLQAVVVRGFDPDAVVAIKAANDGKGSVLDATYGLGKEMVYLTLRLHAVPFVLIITLAHCRLANRGYPAHPFRALGIPAFFMFSLASCPNPFISVLRPSPASAKFTARSQTPFITSKFNQNLSVCTRIHTWHAM